MEVRVRERLIGALVLVGIVVLLVPAILTGGPKREPASAPAAETQRVEIEIDKGLPPADADVLVPEPEAAALPADPEPAPRAAGLPPPAPEPAESAGAEPASAEKARADNWPQPAPVETRPSAAAQDRPAWAVQLGAFSGRDKAERLVADLRKRGYAAFVLEFRATGQVLHRVRVGPEQDRARAVAIAERLRKDGFQPVVAPHP